MARFSRTHSTGCNLASFKNEQEAMELIFRLFCTEEARNQIFFSACLTGKQDRQPLSVLMQLLYYKNTATIRNS
jgi:hypothetical protein